MAAAATLRSGDQIMSAEATRDLILSRDGNCLTAGLLPAEEKRLQNLKEDAINKVCMFSLAVRACLALNSLHLMCR